MRRAIAHSVLRDFEAAISDFTYYISLDDKNSLAYWQRAVCQAEMDEFNKAEGKGVLNIHSAEADFSDAIRRTATMLTSIIIEVIFMQAETNFQKQ